MLGLCHSPRIRGGGGAADGAARARRASTAPRTSSASGGHATEPRPAPRLPTEGSFRLREYQPGDDVRRIHWVRSLTARQIVVRLPDECPPDRPAVRLVLDTFHAGFASFAEPLACRAPDDLLDALVRVWLGVARALVERGVRVIAVVPVGAGGELSIHRSNVHRRAPGRTRELGARVRWQAAVRPRDLLARGAVDRRVAPGSGGRRRGRRALGHRSGRRLDGAARAALGSFLAPAPLPARLRGQPPVAPA